MQLYYSTQGWSLQCLWLIERLAPVSKGNKFTRGLSKMPSPYWGHTVIVLKSKQGEIRYLRNLSVVHDWVWFTTVNLTWIPANNFKQFFQVNFVTLKDIKVGVFFCSKHRMLWDIVSTEQSEKLFWWVLFCFLINIQFSPVLRRRIKINNNQNTRYCRGCSQ